MNRILLAALSAFVACALSTPVALPQDDSPAEFSITGSEVRTLQSTSLDRSYDLYIKLPPGYGAKENQTRVYPIIIFNDGGYCWLTAVGATRAPFNLGGYEHAILIGMSYAKGNDGVSSRVRDYTPTRNPEWRRFETGGAPDYLDFLKAEVVPFIEAEYRADPKRRMLVGHSLGGLFAAYALLREPGLFSDYVLSSPSFWFHDGVIFDLEQQAAAQKTEIAGRVFLSIGSTETPAINGGQHDMVKQAADFADILRARGHKHLEVRDVVYNDATHLTAYPIALVDALRWMLPGEDVFGG
ncbi:MAG: alpha/beta hydrolase-fold protein [Pseudomonadota bacterium]